MENRNQSRQRGTGLREGWRKAPGAEPERVLREPRPGAQRHALMMAGLGVVGAMAALLFAPQLRVPTQAESGNRSISRTLYPKAPGSPPMVAVPPDQPGTLPEAPSAPVEPAAPVVKTETTSAPNPPDVVIREVAPQPERRQVTRARRSREAVAQSTPRRSERSASTTNTRRRSDRTASSTPRSRTTRRSLRVASSDSKRLARALNSRAYRLQKQGRHREAEPLLREALRHDPDYAYAQYNLGWALVEQGRGSEAIKPLRKTARQQPERWEPKAKLREAYRQAGRRERTVRTTRRRSERRIASSERTGSSTRSLRRVALESRRTRATTSTAGWKGSTDPKEQAFLKAWQEFKTREEREEEERRRFSRRVSEELVSDPRE